MKLLSDPDNNEDNKSHTDKCQKHTDFSYGYKFACCYNDKFSKPVQIYRDKKAVYMFIEKSAWGCWKKKGKRSHHDRKTENDFEIDDRCHTCDKLYGEKHIWVKDKVLHIKNVMLSLGWQTKYLW